MRCPCCGARLVLATEAERRARNGKAVRAWQIKNRKRYRAYQRDYQRRLRARQREAASQ